MVDYRDVAEEDAGSELWNFMRVKVAGKEYLVDTEVEVDHDDTSATDFSTMTDGGTDDDDDHVCALCFSFFFDQLPLVSCPDRSFLFFLFQRSRTLPKTNQTTFALPLPLPLLHQSQTKHLQEKFVLFFLFNHQAEHKTKNRKTKKQQKKTTVPFHVSIEITFDVRVLKHHRTWS